MTITDEKPLRPLPRLVGDQYNPANKKFFELKDEYTFEAKGLNVDYILYIERDINKGYISKKFNIEPLFSDILSEVKMMKESDSVRGVHNIIEYIITTDLIQASNYKVETSKDKFFNYCITLSDKYLPKIYFNILEKTQKYYENQIYLKEIYEYNLGLSKKDRLKDIEEAYSNSLMEIKDEVCNYIALWIHAYRFDAAEKEILKNKLVILKSNRSYGWFQPIAKVNNDLTVQLKTNFGFGSASYFYVLLIYKGIAIFPFMEWINYRYAKVSRMEIYTAKFPAETVNEERQEDKPCYRSKRKNSIIFQDDWKTAIDYINEASNISNRSSQEFVNKFIVNTLDNLIEKLEQIFRLDVKALDNDYRDFNYQFKTIDKFTSYENQIKLMDVKGSIISSTLDIIGKIVQLEGVISSTSYIKKIEQLNRRLLPILKDSIPYRQKLRDELTASVQDIEAHLKDIWLNEGLQDLQKLYRYKELDEINQKKYSSLKERQENYLSQKKDTEQDLQYSKDILNSIKRYIYNIENYFSRIQF